MWSDRDERVRVLARFSRFCRRSPAELLKMSGPTAENRLERWIDTIKASRSTKLSYISTVHSFFRYNHRPLPTPPRLWTRRLKSARPRVDRFLDKPTFRKMLDACDARGDRRTKSMLLVQFQSFAGLRELLTIGNSMGLKIGGELRKGANLVPLHFLYLGRRYEGWISFIGKDACDALRDWFAVRGWPDPRNPYIWPISSRGRRGKPRPLTERAVSNAYSKLAIGLGLRPRKGAGSGVRYGVGSTQVRNLAVACALLGGADHIIVHALAGHKVDWEAGQRRRPDEKLLEQSYRNIEPYISV